MPSACGLAGLLDRRGRSRGGRRPASRRSASRASRPSSTNSGRTRSPGDSASRGRGRAGPAVRRRRRRRVSGKAMPDRVVLTGRRPRRRGRPLLARERVDVVVLPDAGDPQVALGAALEAEAGLLDHAGRAAVARHDRRLDAVQPRVLEGEAAARGATAAWRARGRWSARRSSSRAWRSATAPRTTLASAMRPDEAVLRAVAGPARARRTRSRVPADQRLRVERDLRATGAARVKNDASRVGLERRHELAVGEAQGEEVVEVAARERPDRRGAVLEAHPRDGHQARPPGATGAHRRRLACAVAPRQRRARSSGSPSSGPVRRPSSPTARAPGGGAGRRPSRADRGQRQRDQRADDAVDLRRRAAARRSPAAG